MTADERARVVKMLRHIAAAGVATLELFGAQSRASERRQKTQTRLLTLAADEIEKGATK